jgi:uroporphyrinogen decarboxylase
MSNKPDFKNILSVLRRECPERPTLFEFFHNYKLYEEVLNTTNLMNKTIFERKLATIQAFEKLGYDYATLRISNFAFDVKEVETKQSISLNDYGTIEDKQTFDKYIWPKPEDGDYKELDLLAKHLPKGMKIILCGPGGVLENVIMLTGFENLCYMKAEQPELVYDIFEQVGTRLAEFYRYAAKHESVGALISNDDWGYKSQTMLSTRDMRKYVFPWHKQIVENIHKAGKPAILHSCGCLDKVMGDIINDMKYDGKHSYEDNIQPVEEAYEQYGKEIAILGGIDVDFICRHTPDEIYKRSKLMLERVNNRGSYALGTGNSVPEYIPNNNFYAMIKAANDMI